MSNSRLIDYTRISPNRSSRNGTKIDTISIHCVVGQLSVETIGAIFAKSSAQASSNYGIGSDGRIGMYVAESERSWCTSSGANDRRAITIEVASNTYDPYWVNEKAMKSLIALLADICRRNPGIPKLRWLGNKSLIGQVSEQNMTVHRWFSNKACPGDYLYGKHGYIASEVNTRLQPGFLSYGCYGDDVKELQELLVKKGYSVGSAGIDSDFGTSTENAVIQYQKDHGLDADGIVGTATWNSLRGTTGITTNPETTPENTTPETAPTPEDKEPEKEDTSTGTGLTATYDGIAVGDILKFNGSTQYVGADSATSKVAKQGNVKVTKKHKETSKHPIHVRSVNDAGNFVAGVYGWVGVSDLEILEIKPYLVKVDNKTKVSYRSGPGITYKVQGTISDGGVYTIVQEKNGWGQLRSKVGWVNLKQVTKL